MSLASNMFQVGNKVLRQFFWPSQQTSILTSVEFLAQIFGWLLNLAYIGQEFLTTWSFKSKNAQILELFSFHCFILHFLTFVELDLFASKLVIS